MLINVDYGFHTNQQQKENFDRETKACDYCHWNLVDQICKDGQ
jgi:hypothetical protein